MADEPPPPPPPHWPVWFRATFAAVGVALLGYLAVFHLPKIDGDGHEYHFAVISLARHGTPDLRDDDKAAGVAQWLPAGDPLRDRVREYIESGDAFHAYVEAPRDGRMYPLHFWTYAASAVPAQKLLSGCGGDPIAALQVTNALWLLAALAVVLFLNRRPLKERIAFALLATVTPVIWYVEFSGTEVFSWALGVMALVALGNGRYAVSGLLIGLSATQNPPHLLLGAVPGLAALFERRWLSAAGCAAGGAVGLLPFAFSQLYFGTPSLIADGATDRSLIGVARTLSLLTDLNQGLLPYVPVLLLATPLGLLASLGRREWRPLGVFVALIGMLLVVEIQGNWNSDGRGLMRYLVWMLPSMAWVTVAGLRGRWRWAAVAAAVVVHGGVLVLDPPGRGSHVHQRPIAAWVLTHYPEWYSPDHAIFVKRQRHTEEMLPFWRAEVGPAGDRRVEHILPLAFATPDGEVTKLLVWVQAADELERRFDIDPEYLPTLLTIQRAAEPPAYHSPPPGTVRVRP